MIIRDTFKPSLSDAVQIDKEPTLSTVIQKNMAKGGFQFRDDELYQDCKQQPPFRYSNGDVYSGQWKSGARWGKGKLFLASGSYFEGYFKENTIVRGKYYFVNGNVYVKLSDHPIGRRV